MMLSRASRSQTIPGLRQSTFAATQTPLNTRTYIRANSTLAISIHGTGTGLAQRIAAPPHTFTTDTYTSLGGADSAPSPLAISLGSLSGCNQITGELVARDLGVKTGKWEVEVNGELDIGVLVKGEKGHGNWDAVVLKVKVETNADNAQFELLRNETERRCPLSQLFKRSGVKWSNEWVNVTTL